MACPVTLLLVAEHATFQHTLETGVGGGAFQIMRVATAPDALRALGAGGIDLVLIDSTPPAIDGVMLCSAMRRRTMAPIIVIVDGDDELLKITALDMGADLCLSRPVSSGELAARMGVFLRSARSLEQRYALRPQILHVGPVRLAIHQRRVWLGLDEIQMTVREFDLLACLMRHRGLVVRREQLLREVWGGRVPGVSQTLSVHIRWLRQKVEPDPDHPTYIQTVRQVGYRIDGS